MFASRSLAQLHYLGRLDDLAGSTAHQIGPALQSTAPRLEPLRAVVDARDARPMPADMVDQQLDQRRIVRADFLVHPGDEAPAQIVNGPRPLRCAPTTKVGAGS